MTTPAQPKNTPITDNARFSATTERPESGDYELDVVQAEVAEKLEIALATAQQRIKELEQRLHKILVLAHLATFDEKPGFKTKAQINDEINDIAARPREPKEGEAK